MNKLAGLCILGGVVMALGTSAASGNWSGESSIPGVPPLPADGPALCPGHFLKAEQGKAMLEQRIRECDTRQKWQAYTDHVRQCILKWADLDQMPKRVAPKMLTNSKRIRQGYTVENIAFEAVPGYYVTGNLYRPYGRRGPFPVVLVVLGHFPAGRFDKSNQAVCATLARMGAIALTVDMFGIGESALQTGESAHRTPLALTMQTWGNMCALDLLLSLDDADPNRVGVTGASGGGTQTMLLTALDSRVKVSVPVAMTSSYFFGGCPCESGKPIHRSKEHFTNNAEIAAMAAPRPMLVISDGKDWTKDVPDIEYPFLLRVYSLYGAKENVENVHLAAEGHDYGPSKRQAMYRFMAKHLGLDISAAEDATGSLDERNVTIESEMAMRVFGDKTPLPAGTCRNLDDIEGSLGKMQRR